MTNRPRVLIVENDWLAASGIRALLRAAGNRQVAVAYRADDVVRMVNDHAPTLALVGVRHRAVDEGLDIARTLLERGIRVIFSVTHADEETVARLRSVTAHGILTKPFTRAQLCVAVEAALD